MLLVSTAHNSLSQRVERELCNAGHVVRVEVGVSQLCETATHFVPGVIVCPFLTERVPEKVWRHRLVLIVHPGPPGDRGPSSLDWAIQERHAEWGVTLIQASEPLDAGPVWGSKRFSMRRASKTSHYRREVTDNAVKLIHDAVAHLTGVNTLSGMPSTLSWNHARSETEGPGIERPLMRQFQRQISWTTDSCMAIEAKINAASGFPGVRTEVAGMVFSLYDACAEEASAEGDFFPGDIIGFCDNDACFLAVNGYVWVRQMTARPTYGTKRVKLPSLHALHSECLSLPFSTGIANTVVKDIRVQREEGVACISFDFPNGAMSTEQCKRLREAIRDVSRAPDGCTTLALLGGEDFFGNGIHLRMIEAAKDPAEESWRNIIALNDAIREILLASRRLTTVAVVRQSAAAGGAMLPLACDSVIARKGVLLNLHYGAMALPGSEYWTYLLPRRIGTEGALQLTEFEQALLAEEAEGWGIVDSLLPNDWNDMQAQLLSTISRLPPGKGFCEAAEAEAESRRRKELAAMADVLYDGNAPYHWLRRAFAHKQLAPTVEKDPRARPKALLQDS